MGVLMSLQAAAHGPTPQNAEESIRIDAPVERVWSVVSDFPKLAEWHPLVAACTGNDRERTVTLRVGGNLVESLDERKDAEHTYSYRLLQENIQAIPVSFYAATITVKAAGGDASEVAWKGNFYRADTTNDPPDNLNDAAAVAAMKHFFSDGLKGLKGRVERP
jgi:mxaD protein